MFTEMLTKRLLFDVMDDDAPINKLEEAVLFLKEMLKDNPIPISVIDMMLRRQDITYRTAQRAAKKIGVRMISIYGVRYWKLSSCQ